MNATTLIGSFLLCIAFPMALFSAVMYIIGVVKSRNNLVFAAQRANVATFVIITSAALLVIVSFLTNNYAIQYVYGYSSQALPLFFKVTGLWAGLDGSLLLWTWLMSLYALIVLVQNRVKNADWMPYINACMMTVILFFLGLMIFSNNPFTPLPGEVPVDGRGLNPLLQNIAMVIHPPMLYLGFTGFSVPFAFVVAALITRRLDSSWIDDTRRWTIIAWFFLAIGLILGGAWAYVELGWGGFWAWDPVENAGLLPWLLATAYIHSVMIQKKRGMLKVWNVTLVILAFMLTIFGTYMTRSGIVQSVHAFGENKVLGAAFLSFLAVIGVFSFYLVISRLPDLKSDNVIKSYFSKENAFLFNNVILLVATFTVLWGTMFPTLSELVTGDRITVGMPFFNKIMAPIGLVLLFLMGAGPMISWKSTSTKNLQKNILIPLAIGAASCAAPLLLGITHWYVVLSVGLSIFVFITIIVEFVRGVRVTKQQKKLATLPAFFDLIAYANRRFGAYIVHFGILLIFAGIAGTVYQTEADFSLMPGGSYDFHGYHLKYAAYDVKEDEHKAEMIAHVDLIQDGKLLKRMNPSRNFYFVNEQPTTEVDIYQTPLLDVYLIIGNMDQKNGRSDFKVMLNPFISFVWLGGIVLLLGVVIGLMPRGFKNPKKMGTDKSAIIVFILLAGLGTGFMSRPVLAQSSDTMGTNTGMTQSMPQHHDDGQDEIINAPEGDPRTARLKGIGAKLICQCGGCVRESLASCTCDFAKNERKKILGMMDSGQGDKEIVAAFIQKYGLLVLSAPPEEGFFNVGYWMPIIILVASFLFAAVIIRKRRQSVAVFAAPGHGGSVNIKSPEAQKLAKELEDF